MKAIRVNEFGGPEQLKLEDVPDPQAHTGQVQVRVHAAGINPVDVYICSGAHVVKPGRGLRGGRGRRSRARRSRCGSAARPWAAGRIWHCRHRASARSADPEVESEVRGAAAAAAAATRRMACAQ